jgi:DNA-binding PadR family transcriptional regulator
MKMCHSPVGNQNGRIVKANSMRPKKDIQPGTLALMGLKTVDIFGPLCGYGIAQGTEQIGGDLLFVNQVNQGALSPVLLRPEQEGAIRSEWAPSGNNRWARFYQLTSARHKFLEAEKLDWEQTTAIIKRSFDVRAEGLA